MPIRRERNVAASRCNGPIPSIHREDMSPFGGAQAREKRGLAERCRSRRRVGRGASVLFQWEQAHGHGRDQQEQNHVEQRRVAKEPTAARSCPATTPVRRRSRPPGLWRRMRGGSRCATARGKLGRETPQSDRRCPNASPPLGLRTDFSKRSHAEHTTVAPRRVREVP